MMIEKPTYQELTQRVKELEQSEEKYRHLFETAMVGIYRTRIEDGKILAANDSLARMMGYEDIKTFAEEFFTSEQYADPKRRQELLNQLQLHGKVDGFEVEVKRLDGSHIQIALSATIYPDQGYIEGVIIDITERKRKEEALRESEERFRSLTTLSPAGIYQTDANGDCTYANEAWLKMAGMSLNGALGKGWINGLHPDDRQDISQAWYKMTDSKGSWGHEYRFQTPEGKTNWVYGLATPIHDSTGNIFGYLGVNIDITERKQAEKERENLRTQLVQAQKMEAIGTLAGGVAHDFNNLLMGIQGRTSLMMLETDRFHPSFEHLQEIENCIQKATKLTKQLLGFARGGKYEIRPTDLNDLIENSVQMFGRTRKDITIFKKYEEKLHPVAVDQSQIEQVLLNIFINAWQAMPEGGDLYIQTTNEILYENFVRAYGVAPGKYIKISIRDTGIGMDEKTMNRVFDPFFTTKEKGRGTGFGLASAYGIIKNHDGIINVESVKYRGTTFYLYLPASDKPVIEERKEEQIISVGSETVLLVDDESVVIDVSVQMLKKMGYTVLPAHNGREAIEIFKQNKEKVAIVILDLIMPGMNGGEVYERLKEIDPHVKVLLASGYSINGQAAEILNRGCDGFIQKPFKLNELSFKMREILSK